MLLLSSVDSVKLQLFFGIWRHLFGSLVAWHLPNRDCPYGREKLKRASAEGHYYIKRSVETASAREPRQVHPTALELSSHIFHEAATHCYLSTSKLDRNRPRGLDVHTVSGDHFAVYGE